MTIWEMLLLAAGLSMDAFAVSICKGLAVSRARWRDALAAGLWFGGFQALMPLLGWLLASRFADAITAYDHWIAFILLGWLGGKMIYDALRREEKPADPSFGPRAMLPLALATSIDALAVGVSLAFLSANVWPVVGLAGGITCLLSVAGVKLGRLIGRRFESRAQLAGGAVLILIGVRILLQHLGIWG